MIILFLLPINANSMNLNSKETQYIKDKKNICVCIKNHQEPLVIKEKNGYSGISIEYLNLISKTTHLNFKYIYNDSMEDYLNGVREGRCDMLSLVVKPNRHDFLTAAITIGVDTLVIATLIEKPYISI